MIKCNKAAPEMVMLMRKEKCVLCNHVVHTKDVARISLIEDISVSRGPLLLKGSDHCGLQTNGSSDGLISFLPAPFAVSNTAYTYLMTKVIDFFRLFIMYKS